MFLKKLFFLFLIQIVWAVDFDCVFVGTSPIPLFEALYQYTSGKSVLILEQAKECGGAWKSIDICGLSRVDLGCHQIKYNAQLKDFLEIYGGCDTVCDEKEAPTGFYFSKGCSELIDHLLELIAKTKIALFTNHRLESVFIDPKEDCLIVKTQDKQFTAKKIFYTPRTSFHIENLNSPYHLHRTKYYHLYLLIQDLWPPKFFYQNCQGNELARVMNLTSFINLPAGQQLIVFQARTEDALQESQYFVNDLKRKGLLSPLAYLLKTESYIYEISPFYPKISPEWRSYFEVLNTSSFSEMASFIGKWKQVLKPYREIFP